MRRFTKESLSEVVLWLEEQLEGANPGHRVTFHAPDPDGGTGLYAGRTYSNNQATLRHRGYRGWVDLAELLGCRMLTPTAVAGTPGLVALSFEVIDHADSFHDGHLKGSEKYGAESRFAAIDKLEEPSFLMGLGEVLGGLELKPFARILDLGINSGDEFELLRRICGDALFDTFHLKGIDHSESAIRSAQKRFSGPGQELLVWDINRIDELDLGRFHLILSVGTLHSPGINNSKAMLMKLVQQHLEPGGAVVMGFPNCRWTGGEVVYGARTKNYSRPELSLLFKDVDFAKRYLQQHKFRVALTGKHYVFLRAVKLPS